MKKLLVLAALSLLLLPSVAFADSITFTTPTTAGNGNSSTRNPGNSNYEGGTNQFDLDHHGIVFTIYHGPTPPVPEPATLALLGTGLMSTGFYLRRRRKARTNTEK